MHGQQNIKRITLIVIISGISIEEGFSSVSKAATKYRQPQIRRWSNSVNICDTTDCEERRGLQSTGKRKSLPTNVVSILTETMWNFEMSSCEVLVTVKSVSGIYGLLVYSQKKTPLHTEQGSVWAPSSVWLLWKKKKEREREIEVSKKGKTILFSRTRNNSKLEKVSSWGTSYFVILCCMRRRAS